MAQEVQAELKKGSVARSMVSSLFINESYFNDILLCFYCVFRSPVLQYVKVAADRQINPVNQKLANGKDPSRIF